jgi:hypothetical protein
MRPKITVLLGVCLAVASLLLCSASNNPVNNVKAEPLTSHSVEEAFMHALLYIDQNYNLPALEDLAWMASVDNHPDLAYATHHEFINEPEIVGELQAQFAINPAHTGYTPEQLTVIVHASDDPHYSHKVTVIDSEQHVVWAGTIDVDGHVTEYMRFR